MENNKSVSRKTIMCVTFLFSNSTYTHSKLLFMGTRRRVSRCLLALIVIEEKKKDITHLLREDKVT